MPKPKITFTSQHRAIDKGILGQSCCSTYLYCTVLFCFVLFGLVWFGLVLHGSLLCISELSYFEKKKTETIFTELQANYNVLFKTCMCKCRKMELNKKFFRWTVFALCFFHTCYAFIWNIYRFSHCFFFVF